MICELCTKDSPFPVVQKGTHYRKNKWTNKETNNIKKKKKEKNENDSNMQVITS